MNPSPLLPIRSATVDLTFAAPARLRFFHQLPVSALVRGLMEGALADEPRLWIAAPENGRAPSSVCQNQKADRIGEIQGLG